MTDVSARVREIVGRSFDVDPASLSDTTTAREVEGWDSLAHATLVLRLQRIFNVQLDVSAASRAQDLGALTELIKRALCRDG